MPNIFPILGEFFVNNVGCQSGLALDQQSVDNKSVNKETFI